MSLVRAIQRYHDCGGASPEELVVDNASCLIASCYTVPPEDQLDVADYSELFLIPEYYMMGCMLVWIMLFRLSIFEYESCSVFFNSAFLNMSAFDVVVMSSCLYGICGVVQIHGGRRVQEPCHETECFFWLFVGLCCADDDCFVGGMRRCKHLYVWMDFVPFAELGVGFVLDTGLHDGACNRRTRPSRARGTACVDSEHVLVLHVSWAHSAIWGARRECGEVTFCVLAMHVLRPLDDIRLSAGGLQKCLHRSPWDPQEKNRNYCDRKSPILWPSAVQVPRRVV